jgi:hypothetical protein
MDQDNLSNLPLWTELVQAIKAYFLHKCWYIKVNGAYGGWYWFQSKRMETHVYQYMLSDCKFSVISVSQQSPSSNNFSLSYSNSWLSTNTQTSSHNVSFNCKLRFGKMGNKWQILVTSQHACSISVADKEQIKKHRWEVQRLNLMGFCGELKIVASTIDALCHVQCHTCHHIIWFSDLKSWSSTTSMSLL